MVLSLPVLKHGGSKRHVTLAGSEKAKAVHVFHSRADEGAHLCSHISNECLFFGSEDGQGGGAAGSGVGHNAMVMIAGPQK